MGKTLVYQGAIDKSQAIAEDEESVYCTTDERLENRLPHGTTPVRDRA
jgi:hypothetical protein